VERSQQSKNRQRAHPGFLGIDGAIASGSVRLCKRKGIRLGMPFSLLRWAYPSRKQLRISV
jgi:hypothetical protein